MTIQKRHIRQVPDIKGRLSTIPTNTIVAKSFSRNIPNTKPRGPRQRQQHLHPKYLHLHDRGG